MVVSSHTLDHELWTWIGLATGSHIAQLLAVPESRGFSREQARVSGLVLVVRILCLLCGGLLARYGLTCVLVTSPSDTDFELLGETWYGFVCCSTSVKGEVLLQLRSRSSFCVTRLTACGFDV